MKSILFVLVFLSGWLAGQLSTAVRPAPGGIRLLPGYTHQLKQGFDSEVGTISKAGGVTIQYDIGELAGNYAECDPKLCGWTKGEVWRKKQTIKGQAVVLVYTQEKTLIVSFPESRANFYATVDSSEQLTEMLLMVLTYDGGRRVTSPTTPGPD